MPSGSEMSFGECWLNRSQLEQILIGVLSLTILIAIIFMVLLLNSNSEVIKCVGVSSEICHTTRCLQEAAETVQRINPNIDPCDDFYQFACGNYFKNVHGHVKLSHKMEAQRKRAFLEIYAEKTHDNDHKMVKIAKNLFKECMNETKIEQDDLKTIKEVIKKVGGWPVLEGHRWNGARFKWVQASYMLRQLGYPYSIFLNLHIRPDEAVKDWYIFKVDAADPNKDSIGYDVDSEYVEKMAEVAMIFGAPGFREDVVKEMEATYQFWQNLGRLYYYLPAEESRITVDKFQHMYGKNFDWLEFIHNIAGLRAQINRYDFVLYQPQEQLREWLEFISNTPKRIQANYMMWKVIEKQLPYLTKNLQHFAIAKEKHHRRAEFCLRTVEKGFVVSPIQVMYDRKYLPRDKKQRAEEVMQDIKTEFVTTLKQSEWMEENDKRVTVDKVSNISILIGNPGNYFDDTILNDLDVDVIETTSNTFLSFLAQANRNSQTIIYNQITKFISENDFEVWYIKNNSTLPTYREHDNVIYVPTIATEGCPFHGERPNYLNYAFMAEPFYKIFGQFKRHSNIEGWSNKTKDALNMKMECIENEIPFVAEQIFREKLSRTAYERWVKRHGEEPKLVGVNYTAYQMFWISATHCLPMNSEHDLFQFVKEPTNWADTISSARRNNFDFSRDFNCPSGSKMNPQEKCQIP